MPHNIIRFGNITYEHLEDGVHLDSLTSNYYINNIKKAIKELLQKSMGGRWETTPGSQVPGIQKSSALKLI